LVPLQRSGASQASVLARHTVEDGKNMSAGHAVLAPVHTSPVSHGPNAARQLLPAGAGPVAAQVVVPSMLHTSAPTSQGLPVLQGAPQVGHAPTPAQSGSMQSARISQSSSMPSPQRVSIVSAHTQVIVRQTLRSAHVLPSQSVSRQSTAPSQSSSVPSRHPIGASDSAAKPLEQTQAGATGAIAMLHMRPGSSKSQASPAQSGSSQSTSRSQSSSTRFVHVSVDAPQVQIAPVHMKSSAQAPPGQHVAPGAPQSRQTSVTHASAVSHSSVSQHGSDTLPQSTHMRDGLQTSMSSQRIAAPSTQQGSPTPPHGAQVPPTQCRPAPQAGSVGQQAIPSAPQLPRSLGP